MTRLVDTFLGVNVQSVLSKAYLVMLCVAFYTSAYWGTLSSIIVCLVIIMNYLCFDQEGQGFLRQEIRVVLTPVVFALCVYVVGVLVSEYRLRSAKAIGDFLRAFLFYLAFVMVSRKLHAADIVKVMAWVGALFLMSLAVILVSSPSGISALLMSDKWADYLGVDFSRNVIGTTIALALLPGVYLLLVKAKEVNHHLSLVVLPIVAMMVGVASGSRGTFLALFLSVVAMYWMCGGGRALRYLIAACMTSIIMVLIIDRLGMNILNVFDRSSLLSGRQHLYMSTLESIMEHPVFGYGPYTYKYDRLLSELPGILARQTHPHSMYLDILYAFGFVGGLLYFWSITSLLKKVSSGFCGSGLLSCLAKSLLVWVMIRGLFDVQYFSYSSVLMIMLAAALLRADAIIKNNGFKSQ